jgi:hypothetical protein
MTHLFWFIKSKPNTTGMIIPAKSVGTILSGTNFAIDSTMDTLKNKGILVAKSLCSLANDVVPLKSFHFVIE